MKNLLMKFCVSVFSATFFFTGMAVEVSSNNDNLIRNSSFEIFDGKNMPSDWVLWKKNQDRLEKVSDGSSPDGASHIRLIGSEKSKSFLRTELYPVTPGKYIVRGMMRGKGKLSVLVYLYQKNIPEEIPLSVQDAGSDWKPFKIPFEIPLGKNRFSLILRTDNRIEIDHVTVVPNAEQQKLPGVSRYLKNKEMSVTIASPESGGAVISIKNAQGKELVQSPNGGIWQLQLRKINFAPRDPVVYLNCDPEQDDKINDQNDTDCLIISSENLKNAKVEVLEKNGVLTYRWSGMDIENEKNVLDVSVRYRLDEKGFCLIDGEFENRSKIYTVFYYALPRLSGVGGLDGKYSEDYLAIPTNNGRLIRNPVKDGLLRGKNVHLTANSAGHSLQMDLYYNNGNGLYFGTFDQVLYNKRYQVSADPVKRIGFTVMNLPDNMKKVPQIWKMPYSAGFKTFKGDWYDGCMIYRDWALKQSWCSQGPLISRKSTPDWFKEADILADVPVHRIRDSLENTNRFFKEFSNCNFVSQVFYWGLDNSHFETMSPDRYPLSKLDETYIAYHKERNLKMIAYLQATAWSDISTSFKADPVQAEKNVVRNYYGQSLYWELAKKQYGKHRIAWPGKYWINILGDVIEKMARSGFDGAYMDSGNHSGHYLNFTEAHPGESGGGTGYIHGSQNLLRSLRARAHKINPEFVFTAESFWEGNIAHLDAFWVINNTNSPIDRDRVLPIPMVQAVYHDYTIMYGLYESRWDIDYDRALSWAAKTGITLAWGVRPGGLSPNLFYTAENGKLGQEISRKILEAYSKSRKFLTYGTMLRPPVISNPKKIDIRWCWGYSKNFQNLRYDSIVTTAWRSPEGDTALFFYNLTETPQQFSATLKKKEYSLEKIAGSFKNVYPEKFTPEIVVHGDSFTVSGTLPPRIPVIFEVR